MKCHSSWINNYSLIENFLYDYFNMREYKNKDLTKINSYGYCVLTISNFELVKRMKRKVLELNLPVLDRKWSKIDLELEQRGSLKYLYYHAANKLYEEGMDIQGICNTLNIKNHYPMVWMWFNR